MHQQRYREQPRQHEADVAWRGERRHARMRVAARGSANARAPGDSMPRNREDKPLGCFTACARRARQRPRDGVCAARRDSTCAAAARPHCDCVSLTRFTVTCFVVRRLKMRLLRRARACAGEPGGVRAATPTQRTACRG